MISQEDKKKIRLLLGRTFNGTIVTDPVLDPFIIVRYEDKSFAIYKVRGEGEELRLTLDCYPSTFDSCLDRIAKEKHHEEGKTYDSIREYIEDWVKVSDRVRKAFTEFNIPRI